MKKIGRYLPFCFSAGLLLCLVFFSPQAKTAASDALTLCAVTLVPTLFPFYTAVHLFLNAGVLPGGRGIDALMNRLFCLPGAAFPALLLGTLGGYPVGASVTASLYRKGQITKDEAIRLSMFVNNAGPGFILGAVGLTVFHSISLGLLLLCIHLLSALAVGITVRRQQRTGLTVRRRAAEQREKPSNVLPEAISAALQSMLMICAYIVFCSVCLAMVRSLPLCGLLLQRLCRVLPVAEAFLSGLAELSCGIMELRGLSAADAFVAASVLLGWGGLCVFLQTSSILRAAGLPTRQYLRGKLLQAGFSGVLACVVCAVVFRQWLFSLPCIVFLIGFLIVYKIGGRKIRNSLL